MRLTRLIFMMLIAIFASSVAPTPTPAPSRTPKPRKPKLELRVAPRVALPPADVLFIAELVGGDDLEEFYCPEMEWDWDDGGRSAQESDCEPFEAGTAIERRFTIHHTYRTAGIYSARLTLKRAGKDIATARVQVTLRSTFGQDSPTTPIE